MKKNKVLKISLIAAFVLFSIRINAQVHYSGCSTGTDASAIGKNNNASGEISFAGGINSIASGYGSYAFGNLCNATMNFSYAMGINSKALGVRAIAIGSDVVARQNGSIAIGRGEENYPLDVNINGIGMGIGSNLPTLTVFCARGKNLTGKIAIGNIDEPQAKLHIISDNEYDADILIQSHNGNSAYLKFQNENNNISVGSDNIMNFTAVGFAFTSGKVGIGCTNTSEEFTLAVEGGILTDDVLVRNKSQWPDFVFGKDYNLMSLPELKKFIGENRHLPNVPSESEVAENGVSVSEMQTVLLQKVEELTLYTIQQQEMIEQLRYQCERQQQMIDQLMGK